MSADELNWMQRYAASEVVEHAADRGDLAARADHPARRDLRFGRRGDRAARRVRRRLVVLVRLDTTTHAVESTPGRRSVTPATGGAGAGAALSVAVDDPDVRAAGRDVPRTGR